ncbi:hypothetical protein QUB70_28950 [Microcoleus sp. A003_D6]
MPVPQELFFLVERAGEPVLIIFARGLLLIAAVSLLLIAAVSLLQMIRLC